MNTGERLEVYLVLQVYPPCTRGVELIACWSSPASACALSGASMKCSSIAHLSMLIFDCDFSLIVAAYPPPHASIHGHIDSSAFHRLRKPFSCANANINMLISRSSVPSSVTCVRSTCYPAESPYCLFPCSDALLPSQFPAPVFEDVRHDLPIPECVSILPLSLCSSSGPLEISSLVRPVSEARGLSLQSRSLTIPLTVTTSEMSVSCPLLDGRDRVPSVRSIVIFVMTRRSHPLLSSGVYPASTRLRP